MPDLYRIIERPIITEKALEANGQRRYAFVVNKGANKIQIREAVEKLFNVRVKAVNTMNVKPNKQPWLIKPGIVRISGTERGWKNAIVTLHPDDHIDLFEQI